MPRLIAIAGLQVYAVFLAWTQGGIRTDEAKYLLNIPYPHPPLARWFLSLFDGFNWQACAARVLFATLAVQAVWIVWSMGKGTATRDRLIPCAGWLLSWGVVSQAGAVMMAPLTALQGLVFLWLLLRKEDNSSVAGLVALFWFASLFTAYQIALFFPAVLMVFWRMKLPAWQRLALFALPVFLLCLYTLTNPFALASMLNQAGKDAAEPLSQRLSAFAWLWLTAGSIVTTLAGAYGLVRSRRWSVLLSFLLVCAYVAAGRHSYYAVLFVPFLVAGLITFLRAHPRLAVPYAVASVAASFVLFFLWFRWPSPSEADTTMRLIEARGRQGSVLIQGSFGHQWQYESPYPVLKYGEWLLLGAQAVVCLDDACDVRGNGEFERIDAPVETWVRR